ncbi:MAG: class I SAM-dependent methyltransferase [Candidatus Hodarchaeota archaeon]
MLKLIIRIKDYIINQRGNIIKILYLEILKVLNVFLLFIKIKNISNNCNITNLVDFVISQKKIVKTQQISSELVSLLQKVKRLQPKYILEIGTLNGGTLFLFSRVSRKDAILISIDMPKGKIGSPNSKWRIYSDWRVPLIKRISLPSQKTILIRANSHEASTLYHLRKILNGEKLDFLFIDADHSYKGVKKDFEMYNPLVKNSGLIGFHDIVPLGYNSNDVHKFWEEIKYNFDFDEFIDDRNQSTGGIGVIKK